MTGKKCKRLGGQRLTRISLWHLFCSAVRAQESSVWSQRASGPRFHRLTSADAIDSLEGRTRKSSPLPRAKCSRLAGELTWRWLNGNGQTSRRPEILRALQPGGASGPSMSGARAFFFLRGASPLGLPHTLSREPLRRLAPFAWLTSLRSFASFYARLATP